MTTPESMQIEPPSRRWPFTEEEHAAAVRKLADRPDVLDRALRELAAIARDAEAENRWAVPVVS